MEPVNEERVVGPEAFVRVGIDVGQKVDPSAIAVVEIVPRAEIDRAFAEEVVTWSL